MAGSYPDVPSRRMAWDADGTVAAHRNATEGTPFTDYDAVARAELNDEDNTDVSASANTVGQNVQLAFIFPELREFDGFFGRWGLSAANSITSVETSGDTTNGIDGTWTQQIAAYADADIDVYGHYRTAITSTAANAVRAVRVNTSLTVNNTGPRAIHLYGTISPGETPDRLLWMDEATGLQFAAAKDYGDVPRGSARDIQVRLKNNSASLTATTIQYTAEALYLASGAWYTFTNAGGSTFQSTQQLASLGAGATSAIITARQIIPDAATVGLHAARFFTDVSTWS